MMCIASAIRTESIWIRNDPVLRVGPQQNIENCGINIWIYILIFRGNRSNKPDRQHHVMGNINAQLSGQELLKNTYKK